MVKVDFGFIDSVLGKYGCDKTRVIAIMQEIQNEYKFLPKDALKYIAEKCRSCCNLLNSCDKYLRDCFHH